MEKYSYRSERLEKAKKQVANIRGFYSHLWVYILINLGLLAIGWYLGAYKEGWLQGDEHFERWIQWNIGLSLVGWGIGVLLHGMIVFGRKPQCIKQWEERQIQKYMDQEALENKKKP
ncbi:2TM domain-containing protein [Arenibacter sp. 6A1]|uniref:2TM domain-containing protein n=1 Tax=Arenibacter sp. 6A1 TaxID=2720391 RepID=UPI001446A7B9|nr:2TM domain-containing protein [Arenibacter sp. 6A1]NKI27200.1 2TM domain-containing protein [Arenibacter sp. 6A1]